MLRTLRCTLPLALLVLLFAGCDSSNNGGDIADYVGVWEHDTDDQYLEITEQAITGYTRIGTDCYSSFSFPITDQAGDGVTLADGDEIGLEVDGDALVLTEDDGDVERWTRVDIDPEDDLNVC